MSPITLEIVQEIVVYVRSCAGCQVLSCEWRNAKQQRRIRKGCLTVRKLGTGARERRERERKTSVSLQTFNSWGHANQSGRSFCVTLCT